VYPNADGYQATILKENKGKSGIYRWTNNINGNTYVGSSVDLSRRLRQYYGKRLQNLEHISLIYLAIIKFGHYNFTLEILEYCESADVLEREQYYLNLLKRNIIFYKQPWRRKTPGAASLLVQYWVISTQKKL